MDDKRVYIIAEAGVNHNGSFDMARKLVEVAANAGADAVKFQTFKADQLATRGAPKAEYQTRATDAAESQFEMLKKLELGTESHRVLFEQCSVRGIEFLSTPFDIDSLRFLAGTLGVPRIKLASGEITNAPLLLEAARQGRPLIVSTGMSTPEEIEEALGVIAFGLTTPAAPPSRLAFSQAFASDAGRLALQATVTLLHCTTEYPAPFEEVNLRAMHTLRERFGLPVGLSDHSPGIAVPVAATALGATIIEKHFTLDRGLPGPDHRASLEPAELAAMIKSVREVSLALGDGIKRPMPSESKNIAIARRSIVALRPIRKGELLTSDNVGVRRPGTGISPMYLWDWLGKSAPRDFGAGDPIS
ncbi:MAG: N-acetylneuraminate synthase [Betaproteobacteria bacterium]|nr:N-acetylneuraminate synthase [Betaproteobacteria bacterium]